MVGGCKTRKNGGCYCLCRLHDAINDLQDIKDGHTIASHGGLIYYPDKEKADNHLKNLTEDQKKNHFEILSQADDRIAVIKEKIKTYEKVEE